MTFDCGWGLEKNLSCELCGKADSVTFVHMKCMVVTWGMQFIMEMTLIILDNVHENPVQCKSQQSSTAQSRQSKQYCSWHSFCDRKRPLPQLSVTLKHIIKKCFLCRSCYIKWLDSFL